MKKTLRNICVASAMGIIGSTTALYAISPDLKPEDTICGFVADSKGDKNGYVNLPIENYYFDECKNLEVPLYFTASVGDEGLVLTDDDDIIFSLSKKSLEDYLESDLVKDTAMGYHAIVELNDNSIENVSYNSLGSWKNRFDYHFPNDVIMSFRRN